MRNLIVSSLVSLDGIHDDPQSWIGDYFDEQAAEESLAVLLDSDAMLMGKNTYQYFAPAWSSPSGPRQAHEPAPGLGHRATQRRGHLVLRKRLKNGKRP